MQKIPEIWKNQGIFLNSERGIVTLGSLPQAQKITDIRAEIISDPEYEGKNNREMVLLLIFLYYWERRKLKGN